MFDLLLLSHSPPLAFVRTPPLPLQQVPLLSKNHTIMYYISEKEKKNVAHYAVLCTTSRGSLLIKRGAEPPPSSQGYSGNVPTVSLYLKKNKQKEEMIPCFHRVWRRRSAGTSLLTDTQRTTVGAGLSWSC